MLRLLVKLAVFTLFILIESQSGLALDKIPVCVSIAPQKYFVQQIGKDLVDVQVMVAPGASPHTYEPKPRQMVELTRTGVYFAIGVAFETVWLKKIAAANPKMKMVHTDHGIPKISMARHHHPDEPDGLHQETGHDDGRPNKQGTPDPHIWLSPPLVMIQARAILDALQAVDPAHSSAYRANYNAFMAEIVALDLELKSSLAGKRGSQFMVFHPAWGYFAQTYGLEQVPVEVEGKAPKPAQLQGLIERAREKGITVIFVQPQFSTKSAALIAKEIHGQVVFADPLAEDWHTNLRHVAHKFKAALK